VTGASRPFSPSSTARLTRHDLGRFPGDSLFDRLGRALCGAGSLPRKELFEAWEMGRRVRRLLRGGRIVDVAGGHGLLAHVLLLLDDTSSSALVADPAVPTSAVAVHEAIVAAWPRIRDRIIFAPTSIDHLPIDANDLVVSCHACGALTDAILARASAARARVAVLPCCHDAETCDAGGLEGWFDLPAAVDATRARHLEQQGYRIWTRVIPPEITPKNRLLIGVPKTTSGVVFFD
jgi:hypothetical protein